MWQSLLGGASGGGAGGGMSNQGTSSSDATTNAGGGIGAQTWNLGSGGIQKGVPTWVIVAAVVGIGFVLWKSR
jgi:hypothetical protein